MAWNEIYFADIHKGDRLRFHYYCRGVPVLAYCTAAQDTLGNDYHREHPEKRYVNVVYEDGTSMPNSTIYGPNYSADPEAQALDVGPAYMYKRGSSGYPAIWYKVEREEAEVEARDKALEKVKAAERQLAEARKLLEQADVESDRDKLSKQLKDLPRGATFRTGQASDNYAVTVKFFRTALGFVNEFGTEWSFDDFVLSEVNLRRTKVFPA